MKKKYIIIILIILIISFPIGLFLTKSKNIKIENIKKLSFYYSTGDAYNDNASYEINCTNKCIAKIKPNHEEDNDEEIELDNNTIQKIENILNKYKISSWNNFDKVDKNVLDGNSFSFSVDLKDGNEISARGYMMWPDNYKEVRLEISSLLDEIKENYNKEKISIILDNKEYELVLYNNSVNKELIKLLPITGEMKDLNNNEKYIELNESMNTYSYLPKKINKGDVMLYKSNILVIFYKSFNTNNYYTKVGHIDNLDDLNNNDIKVIIKK